MQAYKIFRDMSLRKKMLLINMMMILPSVLFLTVTLYRMTLQQVEERALSSSEHKVEYITNTVRTLFNDIENFSKLAIINKAYQSVLKNSRGEVNELQELDDIQLMYAGLNSLVESNPYIDSVIIQSTIGNKIYHSDNITGVTEQVLSLKTREKLIGARGSPVWTETFKSPFQVNAEHKNLLSVGRRIINMNNGILTGYLYINIEEKKLSQLYGRDEQGMDSRIMIVNSEGVILSANDPKLVYRSIEQEIGLQNLAEGTSIIKSGNQDMIVSSQALGINNWSVLYVVPTRSLMKDQWKITLFIIGFGVIGLLLAFLLSFIFSNWITRPIIRLFRAMTSVGGGNLDTRTTIDSNDEVGRLAHKFNEMVSRIQKLMDAINREEKQKRELELRLTYSQIKPHFLYNTLEMVRSMALMIQAPDISKVVKALGDFYRMSLNNGQELIPVSQERKHLESYLYIQKIRYRHIDYRIEFDERIKEGWIPNMLLQPLVENAIYHGLREKQHGALCEIDGVVELHKGAEIVCFTVKDNGKGMSGEQLTRIWRQEETRLDLSSFGIRNVQERIRLRYGPDYGITICSKPGEGVEVALRLPLVYDKTEMEERLQLIHEP